MPDFGVMRIVDAARNRVAHRHAHSYSCAARSHPSKPLKSGDKAAGSRVYCRS